MELQICCNETSVSSEINYFQEGLDIITDVRLSYNCSQLWSGESKDRAYAIVMSINSTARRCLIYYIVWFCTCNQRCTVPQGEAILYSPYFNTCRFKSESLKDGKQLHISSLQTSS